MSSGTSMIYSPIQWIMIFTSVLYLGLFLFRKGDSTSTPPQFANYNFGVKRANGTVEQLTNDVSWVFREEMKGYGYLKLLQRSKLRRRSSELAPLGHLTLTLSFRENKRLDTSGTSTDTLSQDLLHMFTSKRNCDTTLKVKGEEFKVHKFVLAARSPVFAAMFEANMREKNTYVVDILDCDPQAFKCFLIYLYSGKIENLSDNAFELFRIADKYCVKSLRSDCLIYIMRNLNLGNVCNAIILADQFGITELRTKTQDFFNGNSLEIARTTEWESFMKSNFFQANELLIQMRLEMEFFNK